jgi:hypothetical protein
MAFAIQIKLTASLSTRIPEPYSCESHIYILVSDVYDRINGPFSLHGLFTFALLKTARDGLFGGILGILGVLTKTTTMPAFVVVAILYYAFAIRNRSKNITSAFSAHVLPFFFFLGLSALVMLMWTSLY